MTTTLLSVAVGLLLPDPTQPRKTFLKEEIARLAASIAARGVLQPLRIRRDPERECWWVVTGECRLKAAIEAGLTHVPCIEVEGEVSDIDQLSDQVIENVVRNALRPLELARALAKLKSLKGCTSRVLAEELGLSGSAITRAEALLTLPPDVQAMVDDGRLAESKAYDISRLPDEASQRDMAFAVAVRKMNRDQVAEAVRNSVGTRKTAPKGGRISCRLDGGVSITLARAGEPLTKADVLLAVEHLRKVARKLDDHPAGLAQALQVP
jgi:ParB family transcriptional regulator, chromosome partitioning protein